MAIKTKFAVRKDNINGSTYVSARIVDLNEMSFSEFCDYLSADSTVGPADVAAVMTQLEKKLPLILGLGTKVQVSAEGLTIKPTVSGSITQTQLKEKLVARKAAYTRANDAEAAAKVDVDRKLEASDLQVSDLTAGISITFSKRFNLSFGQNAQFKRVTDGREEDTSEDVKQEGSDDDMKME